MMVIFALAWYAFLLVFAEMPAPASGRIALVLAGTAQALSLVPMSVLLLHSAGERYRGRVMGVRTLALRRRAAGAAGRRRADRQDRLYRHRVALLRGWQPAYRAHRPALARSAVAAFRARQRAAGAVGYTCASRFS